AAISPAASVQLSSLGDEDSLSATTGEIALWLERQGMLGTRNRILDIGCGIGRLEHALGAMAGRIVGIDISPRMI
ncbi:methyltransferase domain-containing protein, partial [Mesorhizobium sp.]